MPHPFSLEILKSFVGQGCVRHLSGRRIHTLLAMAIGLWLVVIPATLAAPPGDQKLPFPAGDIEFFESQVRPILVARCYECHSDKTKEPKGGLRVDSRAALLKGGDTGEAIVPGDPKKSLLVDAINYGELYQMPPKTRMPPEEIAVLTKWVERGAPWSNDQPAAASVAQAFDLEARKAAHWCWQPVQSQTPPAVQHSDWPRHDLDRFVLARLEQRGLTPALPADRRTLLRRVYFDLIGLPPSPAEVEAFVADQNEGAYEQVVDRLLQSPQFGERWARHWMDLVRFGETCGHEFDFPILNAWQYRDYLIRALNRDVPYDQFVMEHIAGDLLPNPRLNLEEGYNESIIATGFWFMHEATHAPVDARGDEAIRVDNQIDVVSKAFLGLTVACARCHDHKFDAISAKDYYALAGFVQSSRRQEAMLDPGGKIHGIAEQVADLRSHADQVLDACASHASRLTAKQFTDNLLAAYAVVRGEPKPEEPAAEPGHRRNLARVADDFSLDPVQLREWVVAVTSPQLEDPEHPLHVWRQLAMRPVAASATDFAAWQEKVKQQREAHQAAAGDYRRFADFDAGTYAPWFVTGEAFRNRPTTSGQWDAIGGGLRVAVPGVAHSGQLSPKLQGVIRSPTFTINGRNVYYRLAGTGCEVRMIVDGYVMIEFQQLLFGGMKFTIGDKERGEKKPEEFRWHRQSGDLGMYQGHRAHIEIIDHGDGWAAIDEIWFSDRDTPPPSDLGLAGEFLTGEPLTSVEDLARRYGSSWEGTLRRWREKTMVPDDVKLINWTVGAVPAWFSAIAGSRNPFDVAIQDIPKRIDEATRNLQNPMRVTAIADGTGENERVSIRGNPRTLGDEAPRQLLRALVPEPEPITPGCGRLLLARQIVNPANPLTARVMVNRIWQHLFGRGLVATVDNFGVMGEKPTHPELLDYLALQFVQEGWSVKLLVKTMVLSNTYRMSSRVNPRAVDIDPLNDSLHSMRIRRLEGEAIRDAMLAISERLDKTPFGPSVPVHITPFMQGRGKPANSGPLDGNGRRSVYLEVRRNFLNPMMLAFDTPIPFSPVGRRNVSNVPAQALILMNDPFVVEQANRWASRLLADANVPFSERVSRAYVAAFGRPPVESEQTYAREFFANQGQVLDIAADQRLTDSRVWADYCHVLFNMKEFVFVH